MASTILKNLHNKPAGGICSNVNNNGDMLSQFQQFKKHKTPEVTIALFNIGKMTLQYSCQGLQPSSIAASSSSTGIFETKP